MIIDCHAHLVPPSLLEAIRAQAVSFPSIRLIEDGGSLGFSFAGGKPTRPVSKPLSDLPGRLKWMDEQNIERQVVGGWLDMFGYEVPAEEGANWSRLINTHLRQTAKREPRFVTLATVPLQDGARAADAGDDPGIGVAGDVAGIDQPRHRDQRVGDAPDRIGHAVIMHAVIAAFEHGMDEDHRFQLVGGFPERL